MTGIFRKWWLWGLAVLLVAAAGVTYYLWPTKYKLTVSRETTVLLGPLNPDGTVNYVAALNQMYGEGVTPENNAAVLLIRAAGPVVMFPRAHTRRFFKRLDMEPLPTKGNYFRRLSDYVEALPNSSEAEEMLTKAMQAPWSVYELPMIADWVKANEKPLSLVVSATRRPRYYMPVVCSSGGPLVGSSGGPQVSMMLIPSISVYREATKALVARAMLWTESGWIKDAQADLLACHRLARLVGQDSTLIAQLSALRIEQTACEGIAALAASGKLSAAEARALLSELRSLPPMPDIVETIDRIQRFHCLDWVAHFAGQSRKRKPISLTVQGLKDALGDTRINADWDEMCRRFNYWHDILVAAARRKTFSERKRAMAAYVKAFEDFKARTCPYGDNFKAMQRGIRKKPVETIVALLMPDLTRAVLIQDRETMRFQLAQVAVALAACKAEKGEYPEKLSDLEPEYFEKLPQDLFAEGPLTYRRVGKGYLLYSVGENMKDDGGREDEAKEFDDIAVRAE